MSEAEWRTRKTRVDRRLELSRWRPMPFRPDRDLGSFGTAALEEFPTASGPADYLLADQGDPLAVVEAKKVSLSAQNALVQAQRYARGLMESSFNFDGMLSPFAYSTNGEQIYFQDLRRHDSYSRKVTRFHTPAALRELLGR